MCTVLRFGLGWEMESCHDGLSVRLVIKRVFNVGVLGDEGNPVLSGCRFVWIELWLFDEWVRVWWFVVMVRCDGLCGERGNFERQEVEWINDWMKEIKWRWMWGGIASRRRCLGVMLDKMKMLFLMVIVKMPWLWWCCCCCFNVLNACWGYVMNVLSFRHQ